MEDKPLDRSLMIPILIGAFSVAGILLILLVLRVTANRAAPDAIATSTALQFQFLATEPGIVYPTVPPAGSPTASPSPTEFTLVTEGPTATSELITFFTVTAASGGNQNSSASITPTFQPIGRTYDDSDFALNYTGNWIGQSGVSGVYLNTLHLSNAIGDAVQLSFVGQKIRILYQAGPSLGVVAIRFDGIDFVLDQSATETQSGEWESPLLILSSHTLTITHISGGSINIDSIIVVDTATATPSITSTP